MNIYYAIRMFAQHTLYTQTISDITFILLGAACLSAAFVLIAIGFLFIIDVYFYGFQKMIYVYIVINAFLSVSFDDLLNVWCTMTIKIVVLSTIRS